MVLGLYYEREQPRTEGTPRSGHVLLAGKAQADACARWEPVHHTNQRHCHPESRCKTIGMNGCEQIRTEGSHSSGAVFVKERGYSMYVLSAGIIQ